MSTTITLQQIDVALCEADLFEDEDVRNDYSGRGMYGKECFGITCGQEQLIKFVVAYAIAAAERGETDLDWLSDVRSDSMGMSTIWYWPNVQLVTGLAA